MSEKILLPELGEGIETVDISEVLINPGDNISENDPVLVLESEKATMEIPAEKSGQVIEVLVKPGDQIAPQQPIYMITADAATGKEIIEEKTKERTREKAVEEAPAEPLEKPPVKEKRQEQPKTLKQDKPVKKPVASPAVRRFARELGVDLGLVHGSGQKNRIVKEDVQNYVKSRLSGALPGAPGGATASLSTGIDFSEWGETEQIPLSRIKKITGERLQQAWNTIPHVTQFDEADVTELYNLRKMLQGADEKKRKLSFLPFFMKAVVRALKEMPAFNSSLDATGTNLVLKKYFHIGVAVDTPNGLVVPVIRNADKKAIWKLSEDLTDVSARAREKKILPAELKGGCFTISSLGGISGTGFTPIINPPEVAILGVSRIQNRPALLNGELVMRKYLPLSLSYDHRVIDGAEAARFTQSITSYLTNITGIDGLESTAEGE